MLTVNRLGLPAQLRRSLACTNSIENVMGTVRRVCRNVKRWRNAAMALRWTAAGLLEAAKGFRRLCHKQLPTLRAALAAHQVKHRPETSLRRTCKPHSFINRQRSSRQVQQRAGHPLRTFWRQVNVEISAQIVRVQPETPKAFERRRGEGCPSNVHLLAFSPPYKQVQEAVTVIKRATTGSATETASACQSL
jgi:hypothetical protein